MRVSIVLFLILTAAFCRPTSSEIDTEDLKYYTRILSDDSMNGRESGADSAKKAARFIAKSHEENGLNPRILEFSFDTGPHDTGSYILSGSEKTDAVAMPFSGPKKTESELMTGGYCVANTGTEAELRDRVAGKIVICKRYGPEGKEAYDSKEIAFVSKYRMLNKLGAAGIVFLDGNAGRILTSMFRTVNKNGPAAVFVSEEDFTKKVISSNQHVSLNDFEKPGVQAGRAELKSSYENKEVTGRNIMVQLKPELNGNPERKVIYIGAHYDHLGKGIPGTLEGYGEIHNGADDNASGTAVVIEVMDYLNRNRDLIPDPYDVVAVHFDAEERGLIGAGRFVNSADYTPGALMLNLDMVGRLRKSRGLMVQGSQTADDRWEQIIQSSFQKTVSDSADLRLTKGGRGPSDHAKFYEKNVPVGFIFTGSHANYHRSGDDYETLNYRGMYSISHFVVHSISETSRLDEPLRFQKAKEEAKRSDFDFKVRLGIVPGSYGEDGGILVSGFSPGAPVEKSGIREGDRIIQIGNTKVENMHDLMRFLEDARTDLVYPVIYKRSGKELKTETRLISKD